MFSEKLSALVISCMILGATVSAASSDGENRESSYGDYAVTALKLTAPVAMGAGAIYAAPLALGTYNSVVPKTTRFLWQNK